MKLRYIVFALFGCLLMGFGSVGFFFIMAGRVPDDNISFLMTTGAGLLGIACVIPFWKKT